tara:strand:- start:20999 stop:21592 length:594 start_codon:yes stop_codon:yes gene_type:complete
MLKRWFGFTTFLDDGRICLTNNAAERALRGFALGRKSWLFAGSDRGADRAAFMATLIMSAKLNDIDPQAWLADVNGFIADINTHMESIATSAKEQSAGLAEVNIAVDSMDQTTQQNAAMVEQQNAASGTLANEAVKLKALVSRFRLTGPGSANAGALRGASTAVVVHISPARALSRKLISALEGNAALDTNGDWEEF